MNQQTETNFGTHVARPGRVAVMSKDRVLALDLEMMLRDAGYDVFDSQCFQKFPAQEDNVSSAIVDLGEAPEAALSALMRLSSEQIPHVILSYDAQDVPVKMASDMLRGALCKPICVDELLPLLGQSQAAQRDFRRTP